MQLPLQVLHVNAGVRVVKSHAFLIGLAEVARSLPGDGLGAQASAV